MSAPDPTWGDLAPNGPCLICGDSRDHDGQPHGEATGDGRTRADIARPCHWTHPHDRHEWTPIVADPEHDRVLHIDRANPLWCEGCTCAMTEGSQRSCPSHGEQARA